MASQFISPGGYRVFSFTQYTFVSSASILPPTVTMYFLALDPLIWSFSARSVLIREHWLPDSMSKFAFVCVSSFPATVV